MKFSENWLRELVDIKADRAALAYALTMAGLEVEAIAPLGENLAGVVIAEIVVAEKHPQADRLQVCTVDAGTHGRLQIVCGAPNARVGIKAPLATVGATLPAGTLIKAATLRGVESFGMLCSAKELGLDHESSGLLELPQDVPVGEPLAPYLGLPDASIELKLTPNRPDCLGLIGLAHDVAALFASRVNVPAHVAVPVTGHARRGVCLKAGKDAPRYLGRIIEGIDPAARTPLWLAERLRRAGLRPISAVVDVTHYVMLELGQPLHAFDNDKLDGDIVVRHARAGDTLKLLDGSKVSFDTRLARHADGTYADGYDKHIWIGAGEDNQLVLIADDNKALAVAGVIGGYDSRVTDSTRNIFLEAAHFAPSAIMGRARKLGLHTDASHRFERGVDPTLPERAIERATQLLLHITGGRAGPIVSAQIEEGLPIPQPILLRKARLRRVLGMFMDDSEVVRIFAALGMKVEDAAEGWRISAPSSRFDIELEEDLIEEVARIHGYDRIPTHTPRGALALATEPEARVSELAVREQLAARDYYEAVNLAFVSGVLLEKWGCGERLVPLANPLSADLAVMRPSLLPGLIQALSHNRARQHDRVRLFEMGRVFQAGDPPLETLSLALVADGGAHAEQWGEAARPLDFFDIKGDLDALLPGDGERQRWAMHADGLPGWLHPGRSARVTRDDQTVGYLGLLHPRLTKALGLSNDVHVMELALGPLLARRLPKAKAVPRFPTVRRDIAVNLPERISWSQIEQIVRASLGSTLSELRLFDRYSGKGIQAGRKSLAIGLILQDVSRTLTDADADRCVRDVVSALEVGCEAKWRG